MFCRPQVVALARTAVAAGRMPHHYNLRNLAAVSVQLAPNAGNMSEKLAKMSREQRDNLNAAMDEVASILSRVEKDVEDPDVMTVEVDLSDLGSHADRLSNASHESLVRLATVRMEEWGEDVHWITAHVVGIIVCTFSRCKSYHFHDQNPEDVHRMWGHEGKSSSSHAHVATQ